jgi:chemotaxis signal transduction protein
MHLLSLHKQKTEVTRGSVTIALPDLALFIPIEDVAKIIPLPEVRISAQKVLGLAEIEQQQIIVLDLHYPLYGTNQNINAGYLILLHGRKGLQYGIATTSLPMIQAIGLNRIEPWKSQDSDPSKGSSSISAHQAHILEQIASHRIVSPGKTGQLPSFWLDSDQMIQAVRRWAAQ